VRRAIDKENKKFRDAAKKTYVETVRMLCDFIKKRDKRMIAWAALVQAERKRKEDELERKKAESAARKREDRRTRQVELENDVEEKQRRDSERQSAFLLADESSDESSVNDELNDEIESYAGQGVGRAYSDEELLDAAQDAQDTDTLQQKERMFGCEICRKSFKSQPQLSAHLASKNHRKAEQEAKKASSKGSKGISSTSANAAPPSAQVHQVRDDFGHLKVFDNADATQGNIKKDKKAGKKKADGVNHGDDDNDDDAHAAPPSVFVLKGRNSKLAEVHDSTEDQYCCRGCGENFETRNSCKQSYKTINSLIFTFFSGSYKLMFSSN